MTEESIDTADQARRRIDRHNVESLHQRPTSTDHVPSIPEPVVMVIDLRCDHESIARFAGSETSDCGAQLGNPDKRVTRIVPFNILGDGMCEMTRHQLQVQLVPCGPIEHEGLRHVHVPLGETEAHVRWTHAFKQSLLRNPGEPRDLIDVNSRLSTEMASGPGTSHMLVTVRPPDQSRGPF